MNHHEQVFHIDCQYHSVFLFENSSIKLKIVAHAIRSLSVSLSAFMWKCIKILKNALTRMWSSWQMSEGCCFNYWQLYRIIYRFLQQRIAPTKFIHKEIIHFEHWIIFFATYSQFRSLCNRRSFFCSPQWNPFTIFSSGNFIDAIYLASDTTKSMTKNNFDIGHNKNSLQFKLHSIMCEIACVI